MKGNSDVIMNSGDNSYLLEDNLQSTKVFEKLLNILSPLVKQNKKSKSSNFINKFWNNLVFNPLSFAHSHNTAISSIFQEETGNLLSGSISSILSENLELPINSKDLLKATEDSIKIFHEDFPGDFILEYKGERLGMMMLDKCFNSKGEAHLIYRFNPQIKSFRGLF